MIVSSDNNRVRHDNSRDYDSRDNNSVRHNYSRDYNSVWHDRPTIHQSFDSQHLSDTYDWRIISGIVTGKSKRGAIAGIVIGVIVFIVLLALVATVVMSRSRNERRKEKMNEMEAEGGGMMMGPLQADPVSKILMSMKQ